jgi:hypothetical protein
LIIFQQHKVFCVPFSLEKTLLSLDKSVFEKAIEVESTKSIKIRMPEQSNDYRVVTFGSGGVGKSSLGEAQLDVVLLIPPTVVVARRDFFFHSASRSLLPPTTKVQSRTRVAQSAA